MVGGCECLDGFDGDLGCCAEESLLGRFGVLG